MKILVTGSTGFIGKWVFHELKNTGHNVFSFTGNLLDVSTFPGCSFDTIIHLAAKVDKKYWKSNELYEVNVEGTKNLINHYPDSKIIYISSSDVEKKDLTEYAKTKMESEQLVLSNPENLVVRPPSIFGPGDTHDKLIPKLYKKYIYNDICTISNNSENEYMYVADIANQIILNIDRKGLIRLEGFRIKNKALDKMVRAACKGDEIPDLSSDERIFFTHLKQYYHSYKY